LSAPKWYRELDPGDQEKIDQALHFLMGFACAFLFLGLLLWRREKRQLPPATNALPVIHADLKSHGWFAFKAPGTFEYWAKARVLDIFEDSFWYGVGYTVGHVAQVGIVWAVA